MLPDHRDRPVSYRRATAADALAIVAHPAFRLGFLDAQAGKPPDQDNILTRIRAETPANALRRIRWGDDLRAPKQDAALAEHRYEEGRLLLLDFGLRCRSWGHPDFPPIAVVRWVAARAAA